MNIIELTPYFQGFFLCYMLVAGCLMMARCTVGSMIHGYHEYMLKLSLESELDLLKYCNIDILTLILTQNKLKCTSHWCAHLMLQKQENWQKNFGESEVIHQIRQTFLPPMFFMVRYKVSSKTCATWAWMLLYWSRWCWMTPITISGLGLNPNTSWQNTYCTISILNDLIFLTRVVATYFCHLDWW